MVSGSCSVTVCVKVCVELPRWPTTETLQISPSWDTAATCETGSDLCFKPRVMTCPLLKTTATLNGLSASNNFIDTISHAEATNGNCFVGWFQRSGANIPDLNVGVWSDAVNAARVGLIVGSELTFQLTVPLRTAAGTWFDMSPSGDFFDMDILAIEDPGLPLNMSLSRTVFGTGGSCNYAMCRTGRWTPIRGQEDRTWQAHFVASSQCCANGACLNPTFSSIVSVFLPVTGPVSRWSADTLRLPTTVALTVGESRSLELECTANHGVPVIAMANMSRNGAASRDGAGLDRALFDSTAAAVQCSHGSPANPLRCTAKATVLLTAVPGDEGSVREWCFTCGDAGGVRPAEETCVRVATRLCEYRVQPGDTLRSISRRRHPPPRPFRPPSHAPPDKQQHLSSSSRLMGGGQ